MAAKPHSIPYVSFKADKESIEILELTKLIKPKNHYDHDPEKPHRLRFNAIIFITEGQGQHIVDFEKINYEDHKLIFIRKNQVHAFDFSSKLRGKIIVFTDAFMLKIAEKVDLFAFSPANLFSQSNVALLPLGALNSCHNLLDEIDKEIKQGTTNSDIVKYLFCAFLLIINKAKSLSFVQPVKKTQDRFIEFISLLQQNYTGYRNAQYYADRLAVTYKTLNQICKKHTDKSAKQLIDSYVVLEAKRCLSTENKSVQQLAGKLGFDEATNFVKYFKKHTQMTPTEFKNSL